MGNIFEKFNLDNKSAIITGGAGLLGRQFATTLAQAGAGVIVADISGESAELVADSIRKEGFNAKAVEVDVTNKEFG